MLLFFSGWNFFHFKGLIECLECERVCCYHFEFCFDHDEITTVFPRIVSAETILFWKLECSKYSREETIQGRKLLFSSCFVSIHNLNTCRTYFRFCSFYKKKVSRWVVFHIDYVQCTIFGKIAECIFDFALSTKKVSSTYVLSSYRLWTGFFLKDWKLLWKYVGAATIQGRKLIKGGNY